MIDQARGTSGDATELNQPVWEIAWLFPAQGAWSERDYLALNSSRLVEFDNGFVEVLPMPTLLHQLIVKFIFTRLDKFVTENTTGTVVFAPLPVRLWPGKYREPDVVYLRPERLRDLDSQPNGADIAFEVVSEGKENRARDLEVKPEEYARAGISEYWIVDPELRSVTVLVLDGDHYRPHGAFVVGEVATSVMLEGFQLPVEDIFAVAHQVG